MSRWWALAEPRVEDAVRVIGLDGDAPAALLASGPIAPGAAPTTAFIAAALGGATALAPAALLAALDRAARGHRLLTAAAAAWHDDQIAVAWVGDVRAHLVRDGELVATTLDHSLARDLGLREAPVDATRITTRALGGPGTTVETARWPTTARDVLVLCAPHLHDFAPPVEYLARALDRTTTAPGRVLLGRVAG
jgi:protein phosphatase